MTRFDLHADNEEQALLSPFLACSPREIRNQVRILDDSALAFANLE
jgi:hypothetical protein